MGRPPTLGSSVRSSTSGLLMAELCTIPTSGFRVLLPAEALRGLNCPFGAREAFEGNLEGLVGADSERPEGFQPKFSYLGCTAYLPESTAGHNGDPAMCPLTVLPLASLFPQILHISL